MNTEIVESGENQRIPIASLRFVRRKRSRTVETSRSISLGRERASLPNYSENWQNFSPGNFHRSSCKYSRDSPRNLRDSRVRREKRASRRVQGRLKRAIDFVRPETRGECVSINASAVFHRGRGRGARMKVSLSRGRRITGVRVFAM